MKIMSYSEAVWFQCCAMLSNPQLMTSIKISDRMAVSSDTRKRPY